MANKVTKAPAKPAFLIKAAHGKVPSPKGPVYSDTSKVANKQSTSTVSPSFKLIPAVVEEPRPIE